MIPLSNIFISGISIPLHDRSFFPQCFDEYGYIIEGLWLHFDGIEKGDNSDRWTDLIKGSYFTYTSHSTVDENSVAMDGSGFLTGSGTMGLNAETGTIEACINRTNGSYGAAIIFAGGSKTNLSFITTGSGYAYKGAGSNNQYAATRTSKYTASINKERLLFNDTLYTTKSSNDFNLATSYNLGGRYDTGNKYYLNGKIHSVRIYNRLLNKGEMLHNHLIDDERFNLGLSIKPGNPFND